MLQIKSEDKSQMFVVTVTSCYDNLSYINFFSDVDMATEYAELKSNDTRQYDDGCISYTMYPRVVIHQVDFNSEYDLDSILLEEKYAIRVFSEEFT